MKKSSTRSDEYYTPEWLKQAMGRFDLDPCAGPVSLMADVNNRDEDGLQIEWFGRVYVNPPYSNKPEWIKRFTEHRNGCMLLPASVETKWCQSLMKDCQWFILLNSRVHFVDANGDKFKNGAQHPSILFGFGELPPVDIGLIVYPALLNWS